MRTRSKGVSTGPRGPSRSRTSKVTVSIPSDILEAATKQVREGNAPSLSAYVSEALAERLSAVTERDAYLEFLDRLDEELGPPSDEDYVWARRFISQS